VKCFELCPGRLRRPSALPAEFRAAAPAGHLRPAFARKLPEDGGKELPWPMLVGVGQGRALGRARNAEVPEFPLAAGQAAADFALGVHPALSSRTGRRNCRRGKRLRIREKMPHTRFMVERPRVRYRVCHTTSIRLPEAQPVLIPKSRAFLRS